MADHACAGIECKIRDNCQRYALHLKAKYSAEQGVDQWYIIPDPENCSFFIKTTSRSKQSTKD